MTTPQRPREERFRSLYADAHEDVLRFAQRRVHPPHAEDVVAEAFLRIPLSRLEEINRHYESLTSGGATGAPALAQAN